MLLLLQIIAFGFIGLCITGVGTPRSARFTAFVLPVSVIVALVYFHNMLRLWAISLFILWILILIGATRVSVWELRGKDPLRDATNAGRNIVCWVVSILIGPLLVLHMVLHPTLWKPSNIPGFQGTVQNIQSTIARVALIPIAIIMTYVLIKAMWHYILVPLISLREEERNARISEAFLYKPLGNKGGTYYCIKFEDDPICWRVEKKDFKQYVANRHDTYSYTIHTSLDQLHYIRKKPMPLDPFLESEDAGSTQKINWGGVLVITVFASWASLLITFCYFCGELDNKAGSRWWLWLCAAELAMGIIAAIIARRIIRQKTVSGLTVPKLEFSGIPVVSQYTFSKWK